MLFEFKVLLPRSCLPLEMESNDLQEQENYNSIDTPLGMHNGQYILKKSLNDFFALSNHLSYKFGRDAP